MVTGVYVNKKNSHKRIHRLVMETFRNDELQEKAKEIQKNYVLCDEKSRRIWGFT